MNCAKELETELWNACKCAKFYKELIGVTFAAQKLYIRQYLLQYNTQKNKELQQLLRYKTSQYLEAFYIWHEAFTSEVVTNDRSKSLQISDEKKTRH